MMALSVPIPYATLLVVGAKKWETRSWPLPKTVVGRRAVIATTARLDRAAVDLCRKPHVRRPLTEHGVRVGLLVTGLVPGAGIGTVRFTRCLPALAVLDMIRCGETGAPNEEKLGYYRNGMWAWEVEEPEVFDEPVPCKGYQRFWKWDGATDHGR